MTRRGSSYSMPGSSGHDDFRAKLEPRFTPVDDLSRFVADRIRDYETEPLTDGVDPFKSPGDAAAYRYAKHVRDDCVVFRRIAAEYCALESEKVAGGKAGLLWVAHADGVKWAMNVVANRWDTHPDFQEGWRLA